MRISKGSLRRAERKIEAAKTTGWNTYSIHDLETVKRRLAVQHKAKQDVAAKLGQPAPNDLDFLVAVYQNNVRRLRFIGATSKYAPHQGDKELARHGR
jgi:hypothetical protein